MSVDKLETEEWCAPFGGDGVDGRSMAPFATTPDARIEEMLKLAHVTSDDSLVDLGAGDGIVLCLAWRHVKAQRGTGYEINDDLVEKARQKLHEEGCPETYTIVNADVMEADLSTFSVVFTW
jgi:cyclopropane fatty-acyl-phospholipid synthase-like methyltransferase